MATLATAGLAIVAAMPVRLPFRRAASTWAGPPILAAGEATATSVEQYWTGHTVNPTRFRNAGESCRYLERRARQYPLFREFMDIPGNHAGEVVLDYGCGPGDDLVEFSVRSAAKRIIGADTSRTALELSAARLALHQEAAGRVELLHVPDAQVGLPLADGSVDYVHCGGVLHHTSDPDAILRELRRVVVSGGGGRIMVYNRHSVWFQLFVPYRLQVREGRYGSLSVEEAFERTTDGEDCPISRAYAPQTFVEMCNTAGFDAAFVGGYFHRAELRWIRSAARALADERLAPEHREFLRSLQRDERGLPCYEGRHAGIGGCYAVRAV